jgi:FkbM family methyltransferase
MIRKYIKKTVEKIPLLAMTYRTVRDELTFTRATSLEMPQGFMLKSGNSLFGTNYEIEVTDLIKTYLGNSDGFVDIGANVGYYTCMACSMGKRVVAIEPLDLNLRYLLYNLRHNGWNDVEVFPLGLSAQPGVSKIFGSGTGASLLSGWAGTSAAYCKTIPLSTLDIILGQRFKGKQLLIKADVENAEYLLMKGSTQIL